MITYNPDLDLRFTFNSWTNNLENPKNTAIKFTTFCNCWKIFDKEYSSNLIESIFYIKAMPGCYIRSKENAIFFVLVAEERRKRHVSLNASFKFLCLCICVLIVCMCVLMFICMCMYKCVYDLHLCTFVNNVQKITFLVFKMYIKT